MKRRLLEVLERVERPFVLPFLPPPLRQADLRLVPS